MPAFAIESATVGHIPAIIDIHLRTWEPTYRKILSKEQIAYMSEKFYSESALKKSIEIDGHQFLLLTVDGNTSGFASVSKLSDQSFKLHKIYVLPSCQGTGAGRFLITEVENYVKSQGAQRLVLNVNRYNKARYFYEKMHYRVILEEDIPVGPYWMNDFVLEKDLLH
jgi:GNAT superfamily N-acetyltransferase